MSAYDAYRDVDHDDFDWPTAEEATTDEEAARAACAPLASGVHVSPIATGKDADA